MSPRRLRKFIVFLGSFCVMAGLLFVAQPVLAQQGVAPSDDPFQLDAVQDGLPLGGDDIRVTIVRIIRAALALLGLTAVVIVLYGGFVYMTSNGDPTKIETAKKILINGAIGLAIILSAFTIVQFIFSSLTNALGINGQNGGGRASGVVFQSFSGSGALGNIVQDHYPFRNQTDVARNTKIVVTFAEPIDPSSLIINANDTCVDDLGNPTTDCSGDKAPYFGDCLAPDAGQPFDAALLCDQLDTSAVRISYIDDEGNEQEVSAAALTTYEGDDNDAFTFVFQPLESLGNDQASQVYTVQLQDTILKKDGTTSAMVNDRDGEYRWQFETGTNFDFSPPRVVEVYPREGQTIARNSIIQITFNEAVDPTTIQGISGPNSPFTNLVFQDAGVEGEWRLSNGYKTVEFMPTTLCGNNVLNSCGEPLYCLPVACEQGQACDAAYTVLARTADKVSADSFSAYPFTGITDLASNALDGRSGEASPYLTDGQPQAKPPLGNTPNQADESDRVADNMWFDFTVANRIDRSVPVIERVSPNLDAQDVPEDALVQLVFSKPMWAASLREGVKLTEYRDANDDPALENLRPMWQRVLLSTQETQTIATIEHRALGPNDLDLYYFVEATTQAKDVSQNCLYPGRGPYQPNGQNTSPVCRYERDSDGNVLVNQGCAPVSASQNEDTACVQFSNPNEVVQANRADCQVLLEQISL